MLFVVVVSVAAMILLRFGTARATGDGMRARQESWIRSPAGRAPLNPTGPAPLNPTGPAPLNPTGPAPLNPTGPAPFNPTGPAPLDPTGSFHDTVRDRVGAEPVARSFFCAVHGRGFGSQQSFAAHLQQQHGASLAEAAPHLIDQGGVLTLP